jgi:hypothetical protein
MDAAGPIRFSAGLAGATGLDSLQLDSLQEAHGDGSFLASDAAAPVGGARVAAIGALLLSLYLHRHARREARRG